MGIKDFVHGALHQVETGKDSQAGCVSYKTRQPHWPYVRPGAQVHYQHCPKASRVDQSTTAGTLGRQKECQEVSASLNAQLKIPSCKYWFIYVVNYAYLFISFLDKFILSNKILLRLISLWSGTQIYWASLISKSICSSKYLIPWATVFNSSKMVFF